MSSHRSSVPSAGVYGSFLEAASRFGAQTAVECLRRSGLESWTYTRLREEAESISAVLLQRGVVRGDRCALLAENDARWCAAYLGLLRIGAVPVPLDTTYTPDQVARLLVDSGAQSILVSRRFASVATLSRSRLDRPTVVLTIEEVPPAVDDPPPPVDVAPNDPAVILYTSGTTSDPKGVVLTHTNLLAEIEGVLSVVDVGEGDAVLGVLPLFHALAQVANLLLPLTVGARVVFLEVVDTATLLGALHERGISAFCCVPQFFYLIHERVLAEVARAGRVRRLAFRVLLVTTGRLRELTGLNLGPLIFRKVHRALGSRMRLLVTGGSRFDPRIGRDLYRLGFNILQAYGLTETSGGATVLRPGDRRVDSVGQALPGVELKIIDTVDTVDRVAGTADIGEVAIRGPVVSPGYYRRDDANAVTFRNGWLHTGDLGYLDDAGRLYITGRAKDVIVLGSGKNIYPEEIEAHYVRSPYIKELCVIGRAREDAPASEYLHAVIVPDFEVLRERKILNAREIIRWDLENLSSELPGHKRILSYDVVPEDLPRTTTRKLKRFEIERRSRTESSTAVDEAGALEDVAETTWADEPQAAPIVEALRKVARDPTAVRPKASLELDLGLDSMSRVELLATLQATLGKTIPEDASLGIHTVDDLVEAFHSEAVVPAGAGANDVDPWSEILGDHSEQGDAAPQLVERPIVTIGLFVGAKLLYAVCWLLLGLRVSGRRHLPDHGPFLICPNHQSFLDAFILAATFPFRVFRNAFYVGASEYFETPVRVFIARMIHVVPVDPDTNLVRAMRAGAEGLGLDKILILFPEGERSIDSEIKTFKKGAAILSLNGDAPIVPVALRGLFDLWPRMGRPRWAKLLPFSGARLYVRYGSAIAPDRERPFTDDDYEATTRDLREAVSSMLKQPEGVG